MKQFSRFSIVCLLLIVATPSFGRRVIATIPVGQAPTAVAVNPQTNTIYVSSPASNTLWVIDGPTNSVIATLPMGSEPWSIWFYLPRNLVYVNNCGDQTVTIIENRTIKLKTVPISFVLGCNQEALAVVGKLLYVPDPVSNQIQVVNMDSLKVITEIPTPVTSTPFIVANPVSNLAYVAADTFSDDSSSIVVIDTTTNTVVTTFHIEANATIGSMAVDPENNLLYVLNVPSNTSPAQVTVLDATTGAILGNTVPLGTGNEVFTLPKLHQVLVTGGKLPQGHKRIARSLVFLDADTFDVEGSIEVGQVPWGIAFNPVTQTIYVTNFQSNTVSVIGQ